MKFVYTLFGISYKRKVSNSFIGSMEKLDSSKGKRDGLIQHNMVYSEFISKN